ncbi:MAG TPA: hypothetical protein PKJ13_02375, partial [bacterium]|nr:hypothetical protein [bacterium]
SCSAVFSDFLAACWRSSATCEKEPAGEIGCTCKFCLIEQLLIVNLETVIKWSDFCVIAYDSG